MKKNLSRNKSDSLNKLLPSSKPFSNFTNKMSQSKLSPKSSTASTIDECTLQTSDSQSHIEKAMINYFTITNVFDKRSSFLENRLSTGNNFGRIQSKIQAILHNFDKQDEKKEKNISYDSSKQKKIQIMIPFTTNYNVNKENVPENAGKIMKKQSRNKSLNQSMPLKKIELHQINLSQSLHKTADCDSQLEFSSFKSESMLQQLEIEYLSYKRSQEKTYLNESMKRPQILDKINKNRKVSKIDQLFVSDSLMQKKKFVESFKKQIFLDQNFRKAKVWFKTYKKQHKWWLLQRQLKKSKLWIHELGMKTIFSCGSNEENPFQQFFHDSQNSVKNLVLSYKQAQQHWKKEICNNFNYNLLKEQGFLEENIDWNKKCFISLEDLTRYASLELQTFFCKRELELIYCRLKKSEQLQFFDFMETISKSWS